MSIVDELFKSKARLIGISLLIIALVIAGFALSLREPEVIVDDIRTKEFSSKGHYIIFAVTLTVNNKNIIGGTLKEVESDVYYNGDYIGVAYSYEHYEIKANGESTVSVDLKITNLPRTFTTTAHPTVRVKGTALINVFGIDFKAPFDETQRIS